MATINSNYNKLSAGYLFPEIARRTGAYLEDHPNVEVMRLGIGNTTEPLPPSVIQCLHQAVDKLAAVETYTGYADGSEGEQSLREAIAGRYAERGVSLDPDEIFVSDGGKPDSANISLSSAWTTLWRSRTPAYPVYVDSNVIAGRTGNAMEGQYEGIVYMPCTESNGFFPELPADKVDLSLHLQSQQSDRVGCNPGSASNVCGLCPGTPGGDHIRRGVLRVYFGS